MIRLTLAIERQKEICNECIAILGLNHEVTQMNLAALGRLVCLLNK